MSDRISQTPGRREFIRNISAALTLAPLMGTGQLLAGSHKGQSDPVGKPRMNDTFLRACRGEKVSYTPVWMMRQAGRYLPQYQKLLANIDFLTGVRNPEIAAEITIQPVDIIGVDAAILYSDITTTVVPMGMDLRFSKKGPSYANPIGSAADVDKLVVPQDPEEGLGFVYDAIRICARELEHRVPLIGFAGAPFTVAAYMVEGAPSHQFSKYRRMIFEERSAYLNMMDKLSRFTASYLKAQAAAGANALMLFDSNAGLLGPDDYESLNLPYVKKIIAEIKNTNVPIIYFGLGAHGSLDAISQCGADVIGIDYGMRLSEAVEQLGPDVSVQGNIQPYLLYESRSKIKSGVAETLAGGSAARGHVFNLGHGVPRYAPVDNVRAMVEYVHELSQT